MTLAIGSRGDTVKSDQYILAAIERNNNKFWRIHLYPDHSVRTEWGRVGETGQSKLFPHPTADLAEQFYEAKRREKERKGYQPVELAGGTTTLPAGSCDLETLARSQIRTSRPETLDLVSTLARANVHNILAHTRMSYDASLGTFSTPLGVVSRRTVEEARGLLTQIGLRVAAGHFDEPDVVPAINRYLMLIPQDIGRSRPDPRTLYPNLEAVQQQNAILDALQASLEMLQAEPGSAVASPRLFQAELDLLEDGAEIDRIRKKYRLTRQSIHAAHHLDVRRVFRVEIEPMRRAFEEHGLTIGNLWELWHGTRVGNLLSILKSGFVIPPAHSAHCTGRLLGNGVYLSDQSTKSLNYAYGYWSGGREEACFMFLVNAAMGKVYEPRGTGERLPMAGYDSVFARGGKCGGLLNNEMVVYDTRQVDPVYLVEFTEGGR